MTIDEIWDKLGLAGRNNMPALLFDWMWAGTIDYDQLRDVILDVWSLCEWPAWALDEEQWLEWFDEIGFVSDDPDLRPPEERLTVYRGAGLAAGPRGFSWTPSIETARMFAGREALLRRAPAAVWEAVVKPNFVLAIHNARESEVIVNPMYFDFCEQYGLPDGLPAPKLIETFAPPDTS